MSPVEELGRQLRTLDELRAAGHLDPGEYAAMRTRLMADLAPAPTPASPSQRALPGPTTAPEAGVNGTMVVAKPRPRPPSGQRRVGGGGAENPTSRGAEAASVGADDMARLIELTGAVLVAIGVVVGDGRYWPLVLVGLAVLAIGFVAASVVAPAAGSDRSPEGKALARATGNWAVPVIVRAYKNDRGGLAQANREAAILARHRYGASGQSADGGHVNLGRTVTGAILTSGVSLLFGGSRTKGSIQITFRLE